MTSHRNKSFNLLVISLLLLVQQLVPVPDAAKLAKLAEEAEETEKFELEKEALQSLLGFAIVGFPKCATSSLNLWLHSHPDVRSQRSKEICHLGNMTRQVEELQKLVRLNDSESHNGSKSILVGYKCPMDIASSRLDVFREIVPKTKILVTVRHPVLWFESFYNYRLITFPRFIKGHPNELIGGMNVPPQYLYSFSGAFHRYLFKLGKTSMGKQEMELFRGYLPSAELNTRLFTAKPVPNPIFFVESSQLSDTNETRFGQLRLDLQDFLGLNSSGLPHEIPRINLAEDHGDSRDGLHPEALARNLTRMDICDPINLAIKTEMLQVAQDTSLWIRNYFLKSDEVRVSSLSYLEDLLLKWMQDPCDQRLSRRSDRK